MLLQKEREEFQRGKKKATGEKFRRRRRNEDDGINMKMIGSKRYKGQGRHQHMVHIGPKKREENGNGVGMVNSFQTEDGIGM